MKKIALFGIGCTAILFLANWGSPESSDEAKKSEINYFGTLETWQGQLYDVENISIDYKIKKIPMYEMPTNKNMIAAEEPLSTAQPHILKQNPLKNFVAIKENLSTIQSLEIPEPEHPWIFYKKRKGEHRSDEQRLEFLEVIVTFKGASEKPSRYLIEASKKIYCYRNVGTGPEKREVPLVAMKKLNILGCRHNSPDTQTERCLPPAESSVVTPATHPVA